MAIDVHSDRPSAHLANDAQSDPEPAVPSLPEPDPGVYHHEPARPAVILPEEEPLQK